MLTQNTTAEYRMQRLGGIERMMMTSITIDIIEKRADGLRLSACWSG